MESKRRLKIILIAVSTTLFAILLFMIYLYRKRSSLASPDSENKQQKKKNRDSSDPDNKTHADEEAEDLIHFPGGEDLTVQDILDAPGEVVGKSSYGTLYRATFRGGSTTALLRFLRPACAGRTDEILPAIRLLGSLSHPNLVPLTAFYVGPRGEKLLVHPFFPSVTLSHFLREGKTESHRWETIHRIAIGIARGLEHLHWGRSRPIVHGNLRSKNVVLIGSGGGEGDRRACLSEFGLHLLLNATAGQEMLESSAMQGYKAPELIKMREATRESDVYSLGVILLEMLTRKEDLGLPVSVRNRRRSEEAAPEEEGPLMFFQLAMACCSPSPRLRPDARHVVRKLEEIGR
ncbi:putative kinase-like protein TMKL1 [Acorus calamus]|uniref:Kinase-like protein TMKL1 n=1 Tax=Acorus calamus TaxID=4465 RepID=A0AAV9CAM7_ACOCL|nr:putative kinase-like protein TMKL1 [Acorus calamus]